MSEQLTKTPDSLIEKWMPVIEPEGEWAEKIGDAPKVQSDRYGLMAESLELLERNVLNEENVAGDVAVYNPVLIPLVRRVMPSLIGPEIFGTQPLKASTGLIFYLRSLYQGTDADNLKYGESSILTLTTNGASAGDTVTIGGAGYTIKYAEGYNVLVAATYGVAAAQAATLGGAGYTVSAAYSNESNFDVIFKNYTGPLDTSVTSCASVVASSLYETFTTHNEMGFTIEQDTVTAQSRKLKARWSRELEEDLKNSHNLNAEQVLQQIATDEITREMNREFVGILDSQTSLSTNSFTVTYASLDGRWELEKYQNLCAVISRVRRNIAIRSKRGQGTFMIVTPLALSILEATGKLSSEGVDPIATYNAGTFMGMKVFVDLYADDTSPTIWIGYKGGNQVDAGYFYCPYIPLRIDKGVGTEDNIPRLFFSTRYATKANKFGADKYYAKITLKGFPGYNIG